MEVKQNSVENELVMHNGISMLNSGVSAKLSEAERALIRETVAQGATVAELQQLFYLADTYGLNPLKNEIYFIKKPAMGQVNGQWQYVRQADGSLSYAGSQALLMTGRDGYLKIAQAHADFRGLLAFEVREGDHFCIDADNYRIEHRYGTHRGRILGAWARCERAGYPPVITYAPYEEYHRPGNYAWTQYPSAMIRKVAEAMALKRAFRISGLVTKEELGYQGPLSQQRPHPQPEPQAQVRETLAALRQQRTLYQLNRYVQQLPGPLRQDRAVQQQLQARRAELLKAEQNRPASARQLETLQSMALNPRITDHERSSILQHLRAYTYYTASIQIKSLSDCIRSRGPRTYAAA